MDVVKSNPTECPPTIWEHSKELHILSMKHQTHILLGSQANGPVGRFSFESPDSCLELSFPLSPENVIQSYWLASLALKIFSPFS